MPRASCPNEAEVWRKQAVSWASRWPNNALQLTAYSLRCTPAFGSS